MNQLSRPGVSSNYLGENSVREVSATDAKRLCGCDVAGIAIPYFGQDRKPILDPEDKPFWRLRKTAVTGGHKYHQAAGTKPHLYIPKHHWVAESGGFLAITEGEFKALSLTDPAAEYRMSAVGIGGIWNFAIKGDNDENLLLPELSSILKVHSPIHILFLGDADTSLNAQFALAATRFKKLLGDVELSLPRIPVNGPKGIDDCRQSMGVEFASFFRKSIQNAIPVKDGADPVELAFELLEAQSDNLSKLSSHEKGEAMRRLANTAISLPPEHQQAWFSIIKKPLGVGKTHWTKLLDNLERSKREKESIGSDTLRPLLKNFYYQSPNSSYWKKRPDGNFTKLHSRQDTLLHLEHELQLSPQSAKAGLYLIQNENVVDYAGPVAGFSSGLIHQQNKQILITSSAKPLAPKPGDCSFIIDLLEQFVGREVGDQHWELQRDTLYGIVHQMRSALQNPSVHLPGQALFFVGTAGIGKKFISHHLLTPLYGDRQADATNYFTGLTSFNADLVGAEHLLAHNLELSGNDQMLHRFGFNLRKQIAGELQTINAKFATQTHLRPIQRLTVCLNPQHLKGLMRIDNTLRDKVTILRTYRPQSLPGSLTERQQFLERIISQLPAMAAFLDHWVIAEDLKDTRFGVTAFQHPDLLQMMNETDPILILSRWLEKLIETTASPLVGTADVLFSELLKHFGEPVTDFVADKAELGQMLRKIQRQLPEWKNRIVNSRVQYGEQRNYTTRWEIRLS